MKCGKCKGSNLRFIKRKDLAKEYKNGTLPAAVSAEVILAILGIVGAVVKFFIRQNEIYCCCSDCSLLMELDKYTASYGDPNKSVG